MLTDTTIRRTKGTDKPQKLTDGAGLYLLVNPNGSRWWRFDYRFAGKRKTLSMGIYPDTGLAAARARRDHARKLLAEGIDPGEQRKAQAHATGKIKATPIAADTFEAMDAVMPSRARPHASRPLEALGVSEMEEHVYRALLKHHLATVKAIADTLSLPPRQIRRLLDGLRDKGLATATLERTPRYTAPAPELAIKALASRRWADIERSQRIIPELSEYAGRSEEPRHEQVAELITDQDVLRQTVVHMQQTAETELMGFQVAPALFPMAYPPYVKKGVQVRCISDSSYIDSSGGLESIAKAMPAGGEARVCSSLPTKMLVVDRRLALLPLHSGDPDSPSLLIRPCALLDALCSLFEWYWRHATPMATASTEGWVAAPTAAGLSEGAQSLLPLLTSGLHDRAIALEAGVSEATLTRRIAELMKHYDTRTRFQLGWRTALEAYPDGLRTAKKSAGR